MPHTGQDYMLEYADLVKDVLLLLLLAVSLSRCRLACTSRAVQSWILSTPQRNWRARPHSCLATGLSIAVLPVLCAAHTNP